MKQARFTRDRVSALSKPDLIDLVMKLAARNALLQTRFDELEKQNRQLQEQNASLVQRVSDLERRLGLNSLFLLAAGLWFSASAFRRHLSWFSPKYARIIEADVGTQSGSRQDRPGDAGQSDWDLCGTSRTTSCSEITGAGIFRALTTPCRKLISAKASVAVTRGLATACTSDEAVLKRRNTLGKENA